MPLQQCSCGSGPSFQIIIRHACLNAPGAVADLLLSLQMQPAPPSICLPHRVARCMAAPQLRVTIPPELAAAGGASSPEARVAASLAAGQRTLPRASMVVHGGDLCYPSPTGGQRRCLGGHVGLSICCLCPANRPADAGHRPLRCCLLCPCAAAASICSLAHSTHPHRRGVRDAAVWALPGGLSPTPPCAPRPPGGQQARPAAGALGGSGRGRVPLWRRQRCHGLRHAWRQAGGCRAAMQVGAGAGCKGGLSSACCWHRLRQPASCYNSAGVSRRAVLVAPGHAGPYLTTAPLLPMQAVRKGGRPARL